MAFVAFDREVQLAAWQGVVQPLFQPVAVEFKLLIEPVAIGPPGYEIEVSWPPAAGAGLVEVDAALAQVGGAVVSETLQGLAASGSGAHREIAVPAGKRLQSVTLSGLEWVDAEGNAIELRSASDLTGQLRVVLSVPQGSDWRPLYSVPPIWATEFRPTSLAGATLGGGVLRFPPVEADKVRLSLVDGATPDEFQPQTMNVSISTGEAAVLPRDPELLDPAGGQLWAFPGELTTELGMTDVDLRFSLQDALQTALDAGEPLTATFRLQAAEAAEAYLSFGGAGGSLVRQFPGILSTPLEGDPARLALAPEGPPLAVEPPASARADLTVAYAGIRVLEEASDELPASPGGVAGRILGEEWVARAMPPAALGGLPLARIGLVGRSPESCELSVRARDPSVPAAAPGPPGVVEVEASDLMGTVWVELPAQELSDPVELEARCTRGRFFWAGEPEGLVRIAVYDPDPGSRPLLANGLEILAVTQESTHLPASELPPELFRGQPPALASLLFLTVDLSDLELRYKR